MLNFATLLITFRVVFDDTGESLNRSLRFQPSGHSEGAKDIVSAAEEEKGLLLSNYTAIPPGHYE